MYNVSEGKLQLIPEADNSRVVVFSQALLVYLHFGTLIWCNELWSYICPLQYGKMLDEKDTFQIYIAGAY